MNLIVFVNTRFPARSDATYMLQSSAYLQNFNPRFSRYLSSSSRTIRDRIGLRGGPLRRSFVSGSHQPIGQNARTEVAPYETDEHLVPAVPFQHRNQSIVIDGVKEFGKVHFDNPRASFRYVALRLLDSLMCTAPRSKSVAEFRECGIEVLDEHLCDGLLDQTILYSGNPQHTRAAVRFWNVHALHGRRNVPPFTNVKRKCSPSSGESVLRARRRSFRLRPEHLC